jgi:hypothetical protein
VASSINIQQVGIDSFDVAFYLLERFFREEGFDTPAEEMRSVCNIQFGKEDRDD